MTHETAPDGEAPGGPEHDDRLPTASTVPVTEAPGPEDPEVADNADTLVSDEGEA